MSYLSIYWLNNCARGSALAATTLIISNYNWWKRLHPAQTWSMLTRPRAELDISFATMRSRGDMARWKLTANHCACNSRFDVLIKHKPSYLAWHKIISGGLCVKNNQPTFFRGVFFLSYPHNFCAAAKFWLKLVGSGKPAGVHGPLVNFQIISHTYKITW